MIAVVPDRKLLQPDYEPGVSGKLSVPITLVRSDGVIFPHNGEEYVYTPEPTSVPLPEPVQQPPTKRQRLEPTELEDNHAYQSEGYQAAPAPAPTNSLQSQMPYTHFNTTPTVKKSKPRIQMTLSQYQIN